MKGFHQAFTSRKRSGIYRPRDALQGSRAMQERETRLAQPPVHIEDGCVPAQTPEALEIHPEPPSSRNDTPTTEAHGERVSQNGVENEDRSRSLIGRAIRFSNEVDRLSRKSQDQSSGPNIPDTPPKGQTPLSGSIPNMLGKVKNAAQDTTEKIDARKVPNDNKISQETANLRVSRTDVQSAQGCMLSLMTQPVLSKSLVAASTHVPSGVRENVEAIRQDFVNGIRHLTVLFIRFPSLTQPGDNGEPGCSKSEVKAAQAGIKTIQRAMRRWGGTFIRSRCDGEGILAICAYGLPGRNNSDNAVRAVQSALAIVKTAKNKSDYGACVGVTTGDLFCVCVGFSDEYEYTVHGDAMNLCAKLMCMAKGGKGDILCDEATLSGARSAAKYTVLDPLPVKGKKDPTKVFKVEYLKQMKPQVNGKMKRNMHTALQSSPTAFRELVGKHDLIDEFIGVKESTLQGSSNGEKVVLEGEAEMDKAKFVFKLQRQQDHASDAQESANFLTPNVSNGMSTAVTERSSQENTDDRTTREAHQRRCSQNDATSKSYELSTLRVSRRVIQAAQGRILSLTSQPAVSKRLAKTKTHVLSGVSENVEANQQDLMNGIKHLTVLFIRFPSLTQPRDDVDPGCSKSEVKAAPSGMKTVQRAMSRWGGALIRSSCDDKGILAICAYGLPGRNHSDNAVRAVQSALTIVKTAKKRGDSKACVGVTTGDLFCVCVGSRDDYEYTVHGDAINLSAKLMCMANGGKGDILCDEATLSEAGSSAKYAALDPLSVKGKKDPMKVFKVKGLRKMNIGNAGDTIMLEAMSSALRAPTFEVMPLRNDFSRVPQPNKIHSFVSREAVMLEAEQYPHRRLLMSSIILPGPKLIQDDLLETPAQFWIIPHRNNIWDGGSHTFSSSLPSQVTDNESGIKQNTKYHQRTLSKIVTRLLRSTSKNDTPATRYQVPQELKTELSLDFHNQVVTGLYGPIICIVEKIQHMDTVSWRPLNKLLKDVSGGCLFILTLCPNIGSMAARSSHVEGMQAVPTEIILEYRRIAKYPDTLIIKLESLGRHSTCEFMEGTAEGKSILRNVVNAALGISSGMPMIVDQVTLYLVEAGLLGNHPTGLQDYFHLADYIRGKVAVHYLFVKQIMPPSTHLTLTVAAVMDTNITLDTLEEAHLFNTSKENLERYLTELEEAGFLHPSLLTPEYWQFIPMMERNMMYKVISRAMQRRIHPWLAEVLMRSQEHVLPPALVFYRKQSCVGKEAVERKRVAMATSAREKAADLVNTLSKVFKDQQNLSKHLLEPFSPGVNSSEVVSSITSKPTLPLIPIFIRVSWGVKLADVFFMLSSDTSKKQASGNKVMTKKHVLTGVAYLSAPMAGHEEEAQRAKWISNCLSIYTCDSTANENIQVFKDSFSDAELFPYITNFVQILYKLSLEMAMVDPVDVRLLDYCSMLVDYFGMFDAPGGSNTLELAMNIISAKTSPMKGNVLTRKTPSTRNASITYR